MLVFDQIVTPCNLISFFLSVRKKITNLFSPEKSPTSTIVLLLGMCVTVWLDIQKLLSLLVDVRNTSQLNMLC